jgi:hypothetical protein
MTRVYVTRPTTAGPETCWELIADFANIDFFNPHLSRSHLLEGSPERGVGTTRQCDLKDGKNFIRERVLTWKEGESYTVDIYDGTLPVASNITTLGLMPRAGGGSLLFMESVYQLRYGVFGAIMDALVMRRTSNAMLGKVLVGLAEKAEEREAALKLAA